MIFAWFKSAPASQSPDMRIDLKLEAPDWKDLPSIPAAVFTPRNVTFKNHDVTYIDYFGNGLAVLNRKEKTCVMSSSRLRLAQEMAISFSSRLSASISIRSRFTAFMRWA